MELAIEPGTYTVRVERAKGSLTARAEVADGARVTLDPRQFGLAALEPTERRGSVAAPRFSVAGRHRVEMLWGTWRTHDGATAATGNNTFDLFGGWKYTKYFREDLALTAAAESFGVESLGHPVPGGLSAGTVGGIALPVGVQWNPFKGDHRTQAFKPFIAVGSGPVIGHSKGTFIGYGTISSGSVLRGTVGARVGAGFDAHVARSFPSASASRTTRC